MRPGTNGEIILKDSREAYEVKEGAYLLGNTALAVAVQKADNATHRRLAAGVDTDNCEIPLAPELADDVLASLDAIGSLSRAEAYARHSNQRLAREMAVNYRAAIAVEK